MNTQTADSLRKKLDAFASLQIVEREIKESIEKVEQLEPMNNLGITQTGKSDYYFDIRAINKVEMQDLLLPFLQEKLAKVQKEIEAL